MDNPWALNPSLADQRKAALEESIEYWNKQERIRFEAEKALLAQVKAERAAFRQRLPRLNTGKSPKIPLTPQELRARARDRQYQKLYGITLAVYDLMLDQQRGVCAICRKAPGARRLVVDHCHNSKQVRGLLCYRCNIMLGLGEDDLVRLQRAISYLMFS